jgi:hypothetical protein
MSHAARVCARSARASASRAARWRRSL